MDEAQQNIHLQDNELQSIDEYLKQSKTSVLTILFTDIQGFTQYSDEFGDEKTAGMRKVHDEVMQKEIEKEGKGKIIKFIGDAVMAIFSEPSSAVQIAVDIQRRLLHLYEIGEFPLKVRMGLHLGQVTIENKIGPDIFGGHVNKASRVESMAEGGQIFATYSVVDSLKGQLVSDQINFHSHGKVRAKGLKEEFELFEIIFLRSQKAKGPKGLMDLLKSKKVWIPLLTLVIVAILLVKPLLFPPVNMYRVPNAPVILNNEKELNFKNLNEEYKQIHEPILVGKHFIHYQVSYVVRYYAPIEIGAFQNFIKPRYQYFGLPDKDYYLRLGEENTKVENKSFELEFKVVNKGFKITDHKVKYDFEVEFTSNENNKKLTLNYQFTNPLGEVKKGKYEKSFDDPKKSHYESIELGDFKTVEFEIYVSINDRYIKLLPRVGYKPRDK